MNLFRRAILHIRDLPSAFWTVIIATLMNQLGNMAFVFLVLYLSQKLNFSLPQASFAFAVFSASMLITGLIGGSLIDRVGAAKIMMGALLTNGIILLSFPFIHSYIPILFLCFLWGMTYGLYRPASQTLVSHLSSPGMHKITFSVYRLAINLGMSLGPAIGGYLALHSFASIFIANGCANILASLILFFGLTGSSWLHYKPARNEHYEFSLKWVKHDAGLRIFLLGLIPVTMIFFQHESTLAVFLNRDMHLSLSFYGWLFTINTLMIVFFELPLNMATLNWPYRINFILGSIFISLGFAGLLFAYNAYHIIALTMTWTLGEMILFPAASSYIAEIAPEAQRGSYVSLMSASSNLGLLLGPWCGAVVMAHLGANGLWTICGFWGVISIIIFSYLREPKAI